jgi:hypothetical protein
MADYDTKAAKIGGVTVTVSKEVKDNAGDRVIALLKFIAKWAHAGKPPEGGIDNSVPEGPPNRPVAPDQPPGGGNRPDQGLPPSGNHPDQGLPGQGKPPAGGGGNRPDQGLPGGGDHISNDLPSWIANNADEIAKAVLKSCFDCNTAQPHK